MVMMMTGERQVGTVWGGVEGVRREAGRSGVQCGAVRSVAIRWDKVQGSCGAVQS